MYIEGVDHFLEYVLIFLNPFEYGKKYIVHDWSQVIKNKFIYSLWVSILLDITFLL